MATAIIGTLKHLPKASILPTLPETGRPNRIYFIPNEDPTEDIVILGESKAHLRNVLVAIKLYLKHVLKLGVKGNYQIFPVESRGIDFVGYVFRHDYIRVRKGIKNSCRKRIRRSNNLAGILPSYFGWFQHCNAVNLKRTILDEVRKIENK